MKLTDQSAFEAATSLATAGGGAAAGAGAAYITSAARYNEDGQMRGFQFDGQHGQAAAIDAGVAFGGAYLGSALSKAGMGTLAGGYLGGKAASAIGETYKYYNLDEEYHGGYHAMRNADLGAGLSGAASALLGEFNEGMMASLIAGLGYSHEENKRVRADVRSGGSLLDRGISGLGGSAFGQRIGNLFNYGMWETDLSLYDRVREETIRIKSRGGDVGEELGWREQSYVRSMFREYIQLHPEDFLVMYSGPEKMSEAERDAAHNERRLQEIRKFNEQGTVYFDGEEYRRVGRGLGAYYERTLEDGTRVTIANTAQDGFVMHVYRDGVDLVRVPNANVRWSYAGPSRRTVQMPVVDSGQPRANETEQVGVPEKAAKLIVGPYRAGQSLPRYPGGVPYSENILHYAVTPKVAASRRADPSYYHGVPLDTYSDSGSVLRIAKKADKGDRNVLRFTTYAGHQPARNQAWDLWNKKDGVNRPRDAYAPPTRTRVVRAYSVSGYGPVVEVQSVAQPEIRILYGHVTEISADVLNSRTQHNGREQILPSGAYLGTAARQAGYQTKNAPHVHIDGWVGPRRMTRAEILTFLQTGQLDIDQ